MLITNFDRNKNLFRVYVRNVFLLMSLLILVRLDLFVMLYRPFEQRFLKPCYYKQLLQHFYPK